jgi:hypothetical protein
MYHARIHAALLHQQLQLLEPACALLAVLVAVHPPQPSLQQQLIVKITKVIMTHAAQNKISRRRRNIWYYLWIQSSTWPSISWQSSASLRENKSNLIIISTSKSSAQKYPKAHSMDTFSGEMREGFRLVDWLKQWHLSIAFSHLSICSRRRNQGTTPSSPIECNIASKCSPINQYYSKLASNKIVNDIHEFLVMEVKHELVPPRSHLELASIHVIA